MGDLRASKARSVFKLGGQSVPKGSGSMTSASDLFDTDLDAVAQAFDEKCAQNVPKGGLKAVE
jgi:hypothetical protein